METKHNHKTPMGIHYCNLPLVKERVFLDNVSPHREHLILMSDKKWVNGTQLKYYFFKNERPSWKGSEQEEETVRKAFETWKAVGIGLEFIEVHDKADAEIRIGFQRGGGSWSYVGRDILRIDAKSRTMNLGWNVVHDFDTALHEIGHTLGFPHAHQNPRAGIVWDEEAVYESLAQSPNYWSRKKTYHNIIRKIPVDTIDGSDWDPNSIMQYPFEAGLILKPEQYKEGLKPTPGLSEKDEEWVKRLYPPLYEEDYIELSVAKSEVFELENGEQKNFIFKPKHSRKYIIQTFGEIDGVLVLFKKTDEGELFYLSADDDSGEDKNSFIQLKLLKGETYLIKLRQYFSGGTPTSIMVV